MAIFRQKEFAEYDAMRSLYVEIMKDYGLKNNISIINMDALIPVLKGNNVVIEKFVISNSILGKDKYRLYLKMGSKIKLPNNAILPQKGSEKVELGNAGLTFKMNMPSKQKTYSKNNNNNKNNSDGGGSPFATLSVSPNISSAMFVPTRLGNVVKYDKHDRSLVIEFNRLDNVLEALKILPFGIGYKLYLLDA